MKTFYIIMSIKMMSPLETGEVFFPLETWEEVLRYTDAYTTASIAKSCKLLYMLICKCLKKGTITPSPVIKTIISIYQYRGGTRRDITRVYLSDGTYRFSVFKGIPEGGYFDFGDREVPDVISVNLTLPELRCSSLKPALSFQMSNSDPDIKFKCFTPVLNAEVRGYWDDRRYITRYPKVVLTPKTKKMYKFKIEDGYFYFPIGKRRDIRGYEVVFDQTSFELLSLWSPEESPPEESPE